MAGHRIIAGDYAAWKTDRAEVATSARWPLAPCGRSLQSRYRPKKGHWPRSTADDLYLVHIRQWTFLSFAPTVEVEARSA